MARDNVIPRVSPSRLLAAATALIASLAIVAPAAGGGPTTRFVDDDRRAGPNGCDGHQRAPARIKRAIDLSSATDTILVCPGEYVGRVTVDVDDLTIRAVDPWTATIVAPEGIQDEDLIRVIGVSGTLIQWLEILAPTEVPCGPASTLIEVHNAPDTSIRANHLGARGTETRGECGYEEGISVINSDRPVIAWNRIVDFRDNGIEVGFSDDADIHGNSARFLHVGEEPASGDTGIFVVDAERARVARNVVRSLPAGSMGLMLDTGIFLQGTSDATVVENRVSYMGRNGVVFFGDENAFARENSILFSGQVGLTVETIDSRFVRNTVKHGGLFGDLAGFLSSGNVLRENNARYNAGADCVDETDPLANDWGDPTTNIGDDPVPEGICAPPT